MPEPVTPAQPDQPDAPEGHLDRPAPDPAPESPAHELEDEGPDPVVDLAVDAQVRSLLATAPDPGPMPGDVSDRIAAALADEARLRVDPGPLARAGAAGVAGIPDEALGGDVVALSSRANRPRPIYLAAAVAAAVAVVATGASALHLTQRPNGAAAVGDTVSSTVTTPSATATGAEGPVHIQLSTTAYDSGTLATRARALLDHPGAPLTDLAAEAPSLGPIATPIGLASCLAALGVGSPTSVSADLATFDGRPAAIIVVTSDGSSTAWAVQRSCSEGSPGVLEGATPVP